MNPTRSKHGKRLSGSQAMYHELAKSGISLPLLFTPHFIVPEDIYAEIIRGRANLKPSLYDTRFKAHVWQQNSIYRASMQTYLAWCRRLNERLDSASIPPQQKRLLEKAVNRLIEELAPSTRACHSPIQHAYESRGASLVHDLHRMTEDLFRHSGDPPLKTKTRLQVGRHVAATAGAVIYRCELFELIQYLPTTAQVYQTPLLIVPSPLNRFYLCDLLERNSLVRYLLKQGLQVFSISWRNPLREHAHWGLEAYLRATLKAAAQVSQLTGQPATNLFGVAAGGLIATLACKHSGPDSARINSLSLATTDLQASGSSQVGVPLTRRLVKAAKTLTRYQSVCDAKQLARDFAWLSPNNFLWNPMVCNYFSGEASPGEDVFHWNNDTLRTAPGLHCDLLSLAVERSCPAESQFSCADLSQVCCDTYMLAGASDHITAWQNSYNSARALSGKCEFVLVNRGHLRALICPPGSPGARYFTHSEMTENADDWLCDATEHQGSWWPHWARWLQQHAGALQAPPQQLGGAQHPKLAPAPGQYVFE